MHKLGINSAWLENLKGEDREKMREYVLQNQKLLDKAREILYNMSRRSEDSVLSDYDSPSWAYRQAHLNGQSEVLRKLINIFTVQERDDQSQ